MSADMCEPMTSPTENKGKYGIDFKKKKSLPLSYYLIGVSHSKILRIGGIHETDKQF